MDTTKKYLVSTSEAASDDDWVDAYTVGRPVALDGLLGLLTGRAVAAAVGQKIRRVSVHELAGGECMEVASTYYDASDQHTDPWSVTAARLFAAVADARAAAFADANNQGIKP